MVEINTFFEKSTLIFCCVNFIRYIFDYSLLLAVPVGKLIVLDLASDINPAYKRTHSYYGHPFIWCMIENFGGATRLYGKIADNIKG